MTTPRPKNPPIPAGMIRYIFSGTMPGGEKWAAGYWGFATSGTPDAQAAADASVDDISQATAAILPLMSSQTFIDAIDTYGYTGGSGATSQGHALIGHAPGSGAVVHPNQIALCLTMRSATPGRSGRNRMYWPLTGAPMTNTGMINATIVDNFVDAWAVIFGRRHAVVYSPGTAVHRDMVATDADYVADDQRGRRRSLSTARHRHAITYL